jgi:hypothetical protein
MEYLCFILGVLGLNVWVSKDPTLLLLYYCFTTALQLLHDCFFLGVFPVLFVFTYFPPPPPFLGGTSSYCGRYAAGQPLGKQ